MHEHCRPDDGGVSLLRSAAHRLGLSSRATHRVLKVARTIADLAGTERIIRRRTSPRRSSTACWDGWAGGGGVGWAADPIPSFFGRPIPHGLKGMAHPSWQILRARKSLMSEELWSLPRGRGVDPDRLADDGPALEILPGERAVGLEDQEDGFAEVFSGLIEGSALGVGARQLLDESDEALGHVLEHCGQLDLHGYLFLPSGGFRFILGPLPQMLILYAFDADADRVEVVTVQDSGTARSATSLR